MKYYVSGHFKNQTLNISKKIHHTKAEKLFTFLEKNAKLFVNIGSKTVYKL